MKELFINSYCHIKKKNIFINGVKHFSDNDSVDLRTFTKSAYKFLAPSYNKFFKMDEICKLGFLEIGRASCRERV